MKYRVFDKTTNEDITDKYDWVITPDGELYYNSYWDLIGYFNAMYIIVEGMDELNKISKVVNYCHKCVYEMNCAKDKDNGHKCPSYKKDIVDGGYYG